MDDTHYHLLRGKLAGYESLKKEIVRLRREADRPPEPEARLR